MVLMAKMLSASVSLSILLVLTSCGGVSGTISTPQADFTLSAMPAAVTLVSGGEAQDIVPAAAQRDVPSASVSVAPDYALVVSPAGATFTAGAKGSPITVKAIPVRGFSRPVRVIITGLPAGVTASPATLTLTPGIAQHVTITASSSALPGKPTLTFTGSSDRLRHQSKVYAAVVASSASNYAVTASPASVALTAGSASASISVKADGVNGFTGTVNVAITGLSAGITANPATFTLKPGIAQSVTLAASSSAAAGTATLTITGASGTLIHKITVALTITTPPVKDYSLAVSPTSLNLTAGATGSSLSVKATAVNGFASQVSVAITGLPSGVTAQPSSLTLTPGTAQPVTITAAASAAAGSAMLTLTGTSGSLVHKATVSLAVTAAPSPNYTLTLSPTSLTLTAGAAGAPISVKATAANGFSSAVKVTLTGLPTGVTASPASLSLTPGTAQSTTLTASSSAATASSTVTFTGTSGSLTHSAPLALNVQSAQTTTTAPDVTTFHYDVARDGLNAQETVLTPGNVNSTGFGKIGFDTADGKVDAQPLYLANVTIGGQLHNVLYVATEHGSLYAWDADSGKQLWKTSVIQSGETPSDSHNCGQIETEIGITSTPVIDRKQGPHGTIFTVGMSRDANGGYHQRLHAFDITTGAEISVSPTEITASYPGSGDNSHNGNVVFDPSQYAERSALLLSNGNIYTAWTSHCDAGLYTGWIIAYSETTLKQSQVLNLTPNGSQGAIWMAGDGLAADSGGIYLLDANGTFDTTINGQGFPASGDYGNAMLRLTTTSGKLAVADYFEPYNTVQESAADTDLGSGGEILLPDQKDAGGIVHRLIVGAGKDGNIYLADRGNLGKYNPSTSAPDSNIYQQVSGQLAGPNFSTPAYFNGVLYYAAIGDSLKAFPLTNAKLATSPSSHSAATFRYPGATPAVSANGAQSGIVWAVESHDSAAAVLHAYDPTNLGHEYYNSNQAPSGRDSFGNGNKFISPLIVNGKVYIGTQTGVAIFGLLPH